jgi:hypothetical protein
MNYQPQESSRPRVEPLLSFDETMVALGLRSRSGLYSLIEQGLIKPTRILRRLNFHPDEVRRVQQGRAS